MGHPTPPVRRGSRSSLPRLRSSLNTRLSPSACPAQKPTPISTKHKTPRQKGQIKHTILGGYLFTYVTSSKKGVGQACVGCPICTTMPPGEVVCQHSPPPGVGGVSETRAPVPKSYTCTRDDYQPITVPVITSTLPTLPDAWQCWPGLADQPTPPSLPAPARRRAPGPEQHAPGPAS